MEPGPAEVVVGFALFENADLMDVTGPVELLGSMSRPVVRTCLIGPAAAKPVVMHPCKVGIVADASFEDCPNLDVLVVPGGAGLVSALEDRRYVAFLRERAARARYVVGVCAGALGLAAAGLLDGYLATTHWAFLSALGLFPQVTVAAGYPRYVISGNRITTGGVTSGLDMAIALCALLGGEAEAKRVQLLVQYSPRPPYGAGDPAAADPITLGQASRDLECLFAARVAYIRKLLGLKP
ncbi:MAG TPA: DJ-1/PfpI family protein [Thermoanaerobaculia bacterium]|nr:DJ-1/PfpI family protein [Thermoanaerobaculia bacterium]